MTHANKDWIKIRAEMDLAVIEDAVRSVHHGSVQLVEMVESLYNNQKYMTMYADVLDYRLHGGLIMNEPIQC